MSNYTNTIFNYISPVATFPRGEVANSNYNGWQKPPATDVKYLTHLADEPSVEMGTPNIVLDTVAKVLSLPSKIFSLTGQDTSKEISEHTISVLKDYLHRNQLDHIKVISNLYDPAMTWRRTWTNPRTMFITKLISGSCNALAQTIFPQRIFGGGVGGINVYDQYTDVITLNNNDVSMALFAAAQAKATAMRRNPILYNSVKDFCPLMTPVQNLYCTKDVLSYLKTYGTQEDLQTAYKALGTSSGVDFGVDILFNPIFSLATTVTTTYALKGHFFTPVVPLVGEKVADFVWRAQMESLKDQAMGYLYALPFISICALAGYCYGRMQLNTIKSQCDTSTPLVDEKTPLSGDGRKPDPLGRVINMG